MASARAAAGQKNSRAIVPSSPRPSTIPVVSPAATSAPSAVAAEPNEPVLAATPAAVFTPEVQRVTLKDGNFTFLDSAGRVIAKFNGLDFGSSFRTATAIKGSASVEKISLRDRFFIEDLESPLHYDPAALVFSNISAHAAGGDITGRFEMELQAPDSPFTAMVKFRDLQAEKLMTNAGGPAGMIQGRVEGFLDAEGKTADSNALAGHGEIILRDGKLQQYSLLVALGQILQIDELMQLHLEQAEVKYHISPGIVTIDQLLLRSPNIRLTATGTISFSGKLRLDSQLALNDKVRRQLFTPIRENFQALKEPAGYAAVDFKVSGTVDRPKTDLMDKLVGRDLRDLGGVISSLFGHAKKKKKPDEAVAPSPAPTASPSDTPPTPASPEPAAPDENRGRAFGHAGSLAMRVIAGTSGGIRLVVPKTDIRPTMDRVKAAIFSSLGARVIGARVLDLFAGTGALGIEALSRGAASVMFVENDRHADQRDRTQPRADRPERTDTEAGCF